MFDFHVKRWVPDFILADKNGYALAKAIEKAVQALNDTIEQGVNCVIDYDEMPEWRLDELAWEYNIYYDYNADIEAKRAWIKSALSASRAYGTKAGILSALNARFGDGSAAITDPPETQPHHFSVHIATSEDAAEARAAAEKIISATKNVSAILDSITISNS